MVSKILSLILYGYLCARLREYRLTKLSVIRLLCLFTLVQQIPQNLFDQKDFKCSYTHVWFNDTVWVFVVNRRGNLSLWEWDTSCSSFGFRLPCDKIFSLYCHKMKTLLIPIVIFIEALPSTMTVESQSQSRFDRTLSRCDHPLLHLDYTALCFGEVWFLLKSLRGL